jgi:hypothetical protein
MRLSLTVLGGLLLAILIAYGAYELIDIGSRHSFDVATGYGGVRSLRVDGGTGDVHVTAAAAGSEVIVIEHVTEGLSAPDRKAVRGAGGALRLSASCSVTISNNCGVSYTIRVPPGVAVNADSGAGDVDARGLNTSAAVKLSSGNGDVTIHAAAGS